VSVVDQKKPHSLHLCRTPAEFLASFERTAGRSVDAFVERFARLDRVAASLLVGSIPLGIGSSASDIDIVVLIDGASALRDDARIDEDENIVFTGRSDDETTALVLAEVIAMLGGVEVHLEFILASRIAEWAKQVTEARVSLAAQQVRILGRIKTGWVLSARESSDDVCGALMRDNSLEVHCAVTSFVYALQDLEDARVALAGNVPLALHLGRSCVERCFASCFATKGFAHLGSKWLRFLKTADESLRRVADAGVPLLFPPLGDRAHAESYLNDVADFSAIARDAIQRDTAFRVAFRMCPQIYDPRMVSVS
jgi:hypothetical protein